MVQEFKTITLFLPKEIHLNKEMNIHLQVYLSQIAACVWVSSTLEIIYASFLNHLSALRARVLGFNLVPRSQDFFCHLFTFSWSLGWFFLNLLPEHVFLSDNQILI